MTDNRRYPPPLPAEPSPEFSPVEPQRAPLGMGARAVRPAPKKPHGFVPPTSSAAPTNAAAKSPVNNSALANRTGAADPSATAPPTRGPGLLSLQRSQEVALPAGIRQKWLQFQAPRVNPGEFQDTVQPAALAGSTGSSTAQAAGVTAPQTPMAWPTPAASTNAATHAGKSAATSQKSSLAKAPGKADGKSAARSSAQVRLSPWLVSGLFLIAAGGGWFGIRSFAGRLGSSSAHLEAATKSSKPAAGVVSGVAIAAATPAEATEPTAAASPPPIADGANPEVAVAPVQRGPTKPSAAGSKPDGRGARAEGSAPEGSGVAESATESPAANQPVPAREPHRAPARNSKTNKRGSVLDTPIIDPDG